jgi:uncharacterized membrane protein
MNRGSVFTAGIGLGGLVMYILDPARGARRRALVRDKALHAAHITGDSIDAAVRDLRNRTSGLVIETRSRLAGEEVTDEVLAERVRAKIGRVVSHSRTIEIAADQGQIILKGQILTGEVKRLLRTVRSIRGVKGIDNQLQVQERQDSSAGSQKDWQKISGRIRAIDGNWAPAPRLLAGTLGSALVAYGATRRNPVGWGLGAVGLGLVTRAATNRQIGQLAGIGAQEKVVEVRKSITIAAPIEEVFYFWDNYENFPYFMHNVIEVQAIGTNRSCWIVATPAGTRVRWEAVTTERIPNEMIAWETVPGSTVEHSGQVRLTTNPDGTTRVTVRLRYTPPAGALGHAIATILGFDPKTKMDEDLVRLKTMIETGNPPHDASLHLPNERDSTLLPES